MSLSRSRLRPIRPTVRSGSGMSRHADDRWREVWDWRGQCTLREGEGDLPVPCDPIRLSSSPVIRWIATALAIGAVSGTVLVLLRHVSRLYAPWTVERSRASRPRLARSGVADTAQLFAEVDRYLVSEMRALRAPGVAIAVVHGDRIVHLRGFGEADPSGRRMRGDTPFILGSLSKAFTAVAVIQLADAGRLQLDDPVQRYLPWFHVRDRNASAAFASP